MKRKYHYIMIRCKQSTQKEWSELLKRFRKQGLKAEDLFLLGMKCVEQRIKDKCG